jgi:hypothetical protein
MFGVVLLASGALVLIVALLVSLLPVPRMVLTVTVVLAALGVLAAGVFLGRLAYVVRTTVDGYKVRFVRGAGVKQGRWADVEEVVTNHVAGSPCLVLRLRNGSTTTIPVEVLAVDREQFVRDIGVHLQERGFKPERRKRA